MEPKPRPTYDPKPWLMDSVNKELYEKDLRIWELEKLLYGSQERLEFRNGQIGYGWDYSKGPLIP